MGTEPILNEVDLIMIIVGLVYTTFFGMIYFLILRPISKERKKL